MKIYDITRTISATIATFPGDTPFSAERKAALSNGDPVNLFTFHTTAHIGTHADAPYHYDDSGLHPDQLNLERYIGLAHVVTVKRSSGAIIPDDLAHVDLRGAKRLLLHTTASEFPSDQWNPNYPYPSVELIDWIAEIGVVLIGVDGFSVDPPTSKTLDSHHRLNYHDIYILETLCLTGVPDGTYELIALPLKIAGVCGTPVRAILRTLD